MPGPDAAADRWSRLKQAFQGALESAPGQRERFRPQGALRSQRESLSLARALASGPSPSARDRFEVARSLASTGEAERALGLSAEALAHLQEAVALLEALAGHDPANADLQAERAQAAAQLDLAQGR